MYNEKELMFDIEYRPFKVTFLDRSNGEFAYKSGTYYVHEDLFDFRLRLSQGVHSPTFFVALRDLKHFEEVSE